MVMIQTTLTHAQKLKFNSQSVQRIERKRTDVQTDGQTDAIESIALPSRLTRSLKIRE